MNKLQGKKVLVTGAGGFIGSHLAEKLVDIGCDVRAMVHYNALGSRGWLEHSSKAGEMEIIAGDLGDRGSVSAAMKSCETVFHLGALIAIPYSYIAPASYVRANIEGSLNVLTAALDTGAKVLQTSTSEVYGTALTVPISEQHPLQGQSPYSATKIGADKLAESFHAAFGLPVVVIRPFNTFGPRQSARAVIPTIIAQCANGPKIKLGSLKPTRDLNYVSNTVSGFIAAAASADAIGETINLGSGREISIEALALTIAELMGKNITIESQSDRLRPEKSEVFRLVADSTKANRLLGWSAETSLEEGLGKTIDWVLQNSKIFRPEEYTL